jgi:hypothetical protein
MNRVRQGKYRSHFVTILAFSLTLAHPQSKAQTSLTYPIVDTGQKKCYNSSLEIGAPSSGQAFYGQDAQKQGNQPRYRDNGDGTISDLVTGLMWQKTADLNGDGKINASDKVTFAQGVAGAQTCRTGGYNDWRLPSIKELYSLIMFNGIDPSGWQGTDTGDLTSFLDTTYFAFGYGDLTAGERIIDAQYMSSTKYVTTTMVNDETDFGVNFADGRIKGYGLTIRGTDKTFYVKYVRGNSDYGKNRFRDNHNGIITDEATGLMWQQVDSKAGLTWADALSWVQQKNTEKYLGYGDWRLPNVKELQSIIDYTRSPKTNGTAAIDPLFTCSATTSEGGSTTFPFYWSSTTHANMMNGSYAAYVCFGEAFGWMQDPIGTYQLLDVHGAGAQRSDPKSGNPTDYPYGHGPQGDVIRIYNYVRMVRDASPATNIGDDTQEARDIPGGFRLDQNFPNPFNPSTVIGYTVGGAGSQASGVSEVSLVVYDLLGREVATLAEGEKSPGEYAVTFNGSALASGLYIYRLTAGNFRQTRKMILSR